MDFCLNWKRPYSTTLWDVRNCSGIVDRLSSLPDELLLQILSLLPTKDAVVMCMLSRRMRLVFPSISSLDFDDSPISFCLKNPYGTEHFPKFVSFVFNAIRAYQSKYLNRFRLRVGRDFVTRSFSGCNTDGRCGEFCFPDLKFPLLNNLICVPLARCGLRELDLCIQVRIPGEIQLPSEIFTCETLEVLKLDVNLGLDQVSTLPSFRLPNLKLFHFCASVLPRTDFLLSGDGFLTKLISSCPLLEDFTVQAWWNYLHPAIISSPSLRRLCLKMHQIDSEQMNSFVDILTPNLEHLEYYGNLASHYSVSNMLCLVKADINIGDNLVDQEIEVSFQKTLSLIRPLSIVRKLSLVGSCVQVCLDL